MNNSNIGMGGYFKYEHIRNGEVIDTWASKNIVVDQGLVYALNSAVSNVAQVSNWYLALYKNNYTPIATDTAADIGGAGKGDEATVEYDEGTRGAYAPTTTNAKVVINTPVAFTFNTAVDIYGGFMISESAKGGVTGTLLAASKFPSVKQMGISDILNVTYELTIADL